jgi:hypothetical protein
MAEPGTMTDEEILRWALLTAYPQRWQVIIDGRISTNPRDYLPLITSRNFAKAFFGEDWAYYRARLLRHRHKLAYLARFLD